MICINLKNHHKEKASGKLLHNRSQVEIEIKNKQEFELIFIDS